MAVSSEGGGGSLQDTIHDSAVATFARSAWTALSNDSKLQRYVPFGLAGLYALLAVVAGVQLVRIQLRVPEYGWTTQKVFHLLNTLVGVLRCVVFAGRREFQSIGWPPAAAILVDMPALLFFTTYTLLALFWTEIYQQARGMPTTTLRTSFIVINVFVYICEISIWLVQLLSHDDKTVSLMGLVSSLFLSFVSLVAAVSFMVTGGRLFVMLKRFPIESKGRRKKLLEVGSVTFICTTAFITRAVLVTLSSLNSSTKIDILTHPVLNGIYYVSVELLPAALVLFILRKLPPKRTDSGSNVYHAIASGP